MLLSNNGGERLRKISEAAQIEAVSWAVKPMPWGFKRALKRFGRQQGKVLVIGDQLLTDVLGAKTDGVYCALGTFVTGEGISNDKNYKANRKKCWCAG